MAIKKTFLTAGMATALSIGAAALAYAHGPGATGTYQPYGWDQCLYGGGMMGQGHMGQGQMPMMGQGMMGRGMGSGMMQSLPQDLSVEDAKHMLEHRFTGNSNPNVKVGKVEEKDDDTIVGEIVTKDGSLVQSLEVDRHTGMMRPAQ
ncbi:hypothetical protein V5T82_04210 [Magnetovibrio sp. PR-2]|uniref:hypothetical protein n=1 Tax=Magnetovibrio sp. PR-2 TaxID=3120356 RepID=UPI002FCE243B